MIRFLFPALLLAILVVLAKRFIETAPAIEKPARRITIGLGAFTLAIILLVLFRHLHWMAAAITALATLLHEVWRRFTIKGADVGGNNSHNHQASSPPQVMNESEALDILGIRQPYTREQVIDAHRKLMQKLHPDRGGNDYLASKLNQAKDILLDKLG